MGVKEVNLVEVSSPGCEHCRHFREFWQSIAMDWPQVKFREVSVTTPEGQTLAGQHLIFASPGIIINGELFSTGGVNRNELSKKLRELLGKTS